MLLDSGLIERPLKLMFNETAVVIGMTQINMPVLILVAAVAIQSIDRVLEQAAAVAGAGPLRIFAKVTWPLSLGRRPERVGAGVRAHRPAAGRFRDGDPRLRASLRSIRP